MKLDVEHPQRLVDINKLGLDRVEKAADGGLKIGALVRNSDLAHDATVMRDYRVLSEALLSGGHQSVQVLAFDSKRYVGAQIGIHGPTGLKVGEVKRLRNVEYLFVAGDRKRVQTACAAAETRRTGRPLENAQA